MFIRSHHWNIVLCNDNSKIIFKQYILLPSSNGCHWEGLCQLDACPTQQPDDANGLWKNGYLVNQFWGGNCQWHHRSWGFRSSLSADPDMINSPSKRLGTLLWLLNCTNITFVLHFYVFPERSDVIQQVPQWKLPMDWLIPYFIFTWYIGHSKTKRDGPVQAWLISIFCP